MGIIGYIMKKKKEFQNVKSNLQQAKLNVASTKLEKLKKEREEKTKLATVYRNIELEQKRITQANDRTSNIRRFATGLRNTVNAQKQEPKKESIFSGGKGLELGSGSSPFNTGGGFKLISPKKKK